MQHMTAEFYVRRVEVDQRKVVNSAVYVIWLEEARSEYLRKLGLDPSAFEYEGLSLLPSALELRYLTLAHLGDCIKVCCWINQVTAEGVTFGYEISHADLDTVFVTATTQHFYRNLEGQTEALLQNLMNTSSAHSA